MKSEFDYFQNLILREPSQNLKLGERVYKTAYYARLVEVMGKHYPTVQFILDDLFRYLVHDYLNAFSPRTWSVDHIAVDFPKFIYTQTSHYDFGVPSELMGDIAHFEQTQNSCYVAEDVSLLKQEQLQTLNMEDWNNLSFKLAPSSRLIRTSYPVHNIILEAEKKQLSEPPSAEPTFYLFYRQGHQIHWIMMPERVALFLKLQMSENLLSAAEKTENSETVVTEFTQLLIQNPEIFKNPLV